MRTSASCAEIARHTGPIRFDRIELYRVSIPLVEPFRISSGEIATRDAILVRIASSQHVFGWGESSAMTGSFYSEETPEACWKELTERIVPAFTGREFSSVAEVDAALRETSANRFATVALETAAWEWAARKHACSVRELLGVSDRAIPSGLAVGLYDSVDELLTALARLRPERYQRLKIKIKRGQDVDLVHAVRQRYGNIPLFVDANADYTLDDAETFRRLDHNGLMMFEQPLGKTDLEGSARLQQQIDTPICLDESIGSAGQAEEAIARGACRIVNLKLQRVGGFTEALRIVDVCTRTGTPIWMGTMPELGVGSAAALALAAHQAFVLPTDVEPSSRWYVDDVLSPAINLQQDGTIEVPHGPGWGYEVSPAKWNDWCTNRMVA